ncbi:hypothetical protein [Gemmata sp.]|uniref:hypothetical protein n=1 Tax=Gemmata sp. TaxID=1914242 RepID=UPI003F70F82B
MIAEVVASGGEDVFIEVRGTPSPARKLRLGGGPDCSDEWVVLTADAGNRNGGGDGTATAFLAAGSPVRVWDSGDVDGATGRRLMVPASPPRPGVTTDPAPGEDSGRRPAPEGAGAFGAQTRAPHGAG